MLPLSDFKRMQQLAEEDPEALERLRAEIIEEFIQESPLRMQARLRGMQFQIDKLRELHPNGLWMNIKIAQMMSESVSQLYKSIHDLDDTSGNNKPQKDHKTAKVLLFKAS